MGSSGINAGTWGLISRVSSRTYRDSKMMGMPGMGAKPEPVRPECEAVLKVYGTASKVAIWLIPAAVLYYTFLISEYKFDIYGNFSHGINSEVQPGMPEPSLIKAL